MKFAMLMLTAAITGATSSCSDRPGDAAPRNPPPPKTQPTPVPAAAPAAPPPSPSARPAAPVTPRKRRTTPAMDALTPPFTRSTLSGVYTADEAREGRDLYLGYCASCHAAVSHTGPAFRLKWAGRPLSDLYGFMRTNMPKNDPASLDDEQYGVLLAYMLQMNKMPPGKTPLSPDSANLAKIRIDTVRTPRR